MTNGERAAYIKGLMEGLELDPAEKTTKAIKAMAELLEDLSLDMEDLEAQLGEVTDQVEEIDEDLAEVEEYVYDLEDGPDCESCAGCDWDDEGAEFEVNCPSCGKTIRLTDDMLDEGSIVCPGCGETLAFDLDDEEPAEDKKD